MCARLADWHANLAFWDCGAAFARSGQIDFDEFAQWMRYEISRTGTAGSHNNSKAASFLPLDERALLTVIAQVKKVSELTLAPSTFGFAG